MAGNLINLEEALRQYGWVRGNADNIRVSLKALTLLSDETIEFEGRGVTVIAGANNCGKSTLLRELADVLVNGPVNRRQILSVAEPVFEGEMQDYLDWLFKHAYLRIEKDNLAFSDFQRLSRSYSLGGFLSNPPQARKEQLISFFVQYLGAGNRDIGLTGAKSTVLQPPSDPLHLLHERKDMMDELNELTYRIFKKRLHLDDLNQQYMLRVGTPKLPRPALQYEDPTDYQLEVETLPLLSAQGDGMKSLMNILIPLVTATYPILIVDEPEAFLHPPQAFALGQELGKIANAKGVQVILATHDRNILAGLVNAGSPLAVIRMVRQQDDRTKLYQLKAEDLGRIMKDPVLKYSQVLDGLFHEVAILAEAERDCRFYEAALGVYEDNLPEDTTEENIVIPPTEVLFIPTSGTSNMPRLAKALRSLNVPVVACPDLDVLDEKAVVKNIVEAVGGAWDGLDEDWKTITAPLSTAASAEPVVSVAERVRAAFETIVRENAFALFDGEARKRIAEAMKVQSRPWDEVKHHGVAELFRVNTGNTHAVKRVLDGLAAQKVVVVHAGELESFGHELGEFKGKRWLPAALSADLQSKPAVQEHIRRLLNVAVPLTSWGRQE